MEENKPKEVKKIALIIAIDEEDRIETVIPESPTMTAFLLLTLTEIINSKIRKNMQSKIITLPH